MGYADGKGFLAGSLRESELAGYAAAESRHGRGRGDGLRPRGYHNAAHAEHVARSVRILLADPAIAASVSPRDAALLPVAAAWHDAIYDPGMAGNEERSADLMKEDLLSRGTSVADADRAACIVMATVAGVGDAEGGYRLTQAASDPAGRVLCDADVSSWGLSWDELVPWWHGLACEVVGGGDYVSDFASLPVGTVRELLAGQASLLGTHRYYTDAAEIAWGANRDRNAALTVALADALASVEGLPPTAPA